MKHPRTFLATMATGIITCVIILFLSGCGSSHEGITKYECSAAEGSVQTCTVTMPDTRRVTCLVFNGRGIDCDWAHADGADNLEGR